ncbi:hypothetical protein [Actinophytocola sediminis]
MRAPAGPDRDAIDEIPGAGAVRLLAGFPDPDTELLLESAGIDPDRSVRSAATDALLTAAGLAGDDTKWGEVLWSIGGRLLSALSTVRHDAATELRAIRLSGA